MARKSELKEDISLLTKEEVTAYKETISLKKKKIKEQLSSLEDALNDIEEVEKEIKIQENNEELSYLRKNKDVVLKIVAPTHSRAGCSDDCPNNDYMDNDVPYCKRCFLLRILNDDWEDSYKLTFDVNIEEIR